MNNKNATKTKGTRAQRARAKVKKERSVVESTTNDPKNDRSESIAEMSHAPMTDPRNRVPTSDAGH